MPLKYIERDAEASFGRTGRKTKCKYFNCGKGSHFQRNCKASLKKSRYISPTRRVAPAAHKDSDEHNLVAGRSKKRNDHYVTESADVKERKGRKKIEDNDLQLLPLTELRGIKHGSADALLS